MKRTILFPFVFTAFASVAQPVLTSPTPILTPDSIAPAITPANPGSPALDLGTPSPTNLPDTNVTVVTVRELAPALTNLENTLIQALPVLTAFNDGFDFVSLNDGARQPVANPGSVTVPNALLKPGTSAGASVSAGAAAATAMVGNNTFMLPPGLAGLGTTNGLNTLTLTRETLRALLILQNDLERMLPVLDAVNGGTNFINTVLPSGSLTNPAR